MPRGEENANGGKRDHVERKTGYREKHFWKSTGGKKKNKTRRNDTQAERFRNERKGILERKLCVKRILKSVAKKRESIGKKGATAFWNGTKKNKGGIGWMEKGKRGKVQRAEGAGPRGELCAAVNTEFWGDQIPDRQILQGS